MRGLGVEKPSLSRVPSRHSHSVTHGDGSAFTVWKREPRLRLGVVRRQSELHGCPDSLESGESVAFECSYSRLVALGCSATSRVIEDGTDGSVVITTPDDTHTIEPGTPP